MRLATTFSGIGAIEYAFRRLNLEHEIIFACDNGNIDININYDIELQNIKNMNSINNKNKYVKNLYKTKSKKKNFVEITYKNNYKISDDRFFYDVRLLDGNDFKNKVDLFVGGSPCQSFSIAGARGGFEDTRGTLFYDYVRLIKEIEPKFFIYENVYGVLTHDKGKTWEIMQNTFSQLRYFVKWKILDSRNYGIPQGRRRLFVVGFKDEEVYKKFNFPQEVLLKYTMQDFLLDNCANGNMTYDKFGNIKLKNGGEIVDKYLSDKLVTYVMSPGTKNFYHEDVKIDLKIARAILSTQGNTHRASVNNYVTTNGKIRALQPRESLRLMGFCDDFKQTVSNAQSYKQSGNSIVVDVLMQIIKELIKANS
ncbi:DNA cytosine methyltransferase [Campylobacter devanensis]|uniref:DNA cytosine methyltransferase n=1 Tax=Campylobacter devanensis TaxID=3161138 RepID=UPI000A357531|nr:DNA cytosine methyltransferase [Campylobacter sp. P0138]